MLWVAFESVRHFGSIPMASIKSAFRITALFLLAFAILPLVIVHTRLAYSLDTSIDTAQPLVDFQEPSFLVRKSTGKTNHHGFNRTNARSQRAKERNIDRVRHSPESPWISGCYPHPLFNNKNDNNIQGNHEKEPPKGLVVVLAMAPKDHWVKLDSLQRICNSIPTQIDYFLEPQDLDMLFLVEEMGLDWSMQHFISCWDLKPLEDDSPPSEKTWQNLDGTNVTTTAYRRENGRATIFVGRTDVEYPHYIQKDMKLLKQPIIPQHCQAPREYIQATRWYTRELLNLGILKEYDYFLKIDTDILFLDTIPFHMLQDMANRNAIFGHTAEYHPKGSRTCAQGIQQAIANFTKTVQNTKRQNLPPWKGSLCTNSIEVQRDIDLYYTNFIIGKVSFWQSKWVREFSNFLNEFPRGFFSYRWTDQIFWHHVMGLFLENFQDYVVDYTNLRCMPNPHCWQSSANFERYGQDAWHRCDNGGFFVHPKEFRIATSRKKEPFRNSVWNASASQPLFQSTYQKDCSKK